MMKNTQETKASIDRRYPGKLAGRCEPKSDHCPDQGKKKQGNRWQPELLSAQIAVSGQHKESQVE